MDPVTQGVVGAIAAQQPSRKQHLLSATLLGVFAGMAPDLDVLLKSDTDPLLALEYHRQFTHSLFFIPIGSFLCALLAYGLFFARRQSLSFKQVWLYCALGYATHGVLDACTTYGTLLLWPFSDMRVAWNTISIIDPIFTLPLLVMIIVAVATKKLLWSRLALAWAISYMAFGVVQRERAEAVGWQLAQSRGHQPVKLEAKPSFANLLVWKLIYTTDTHYHVDAIKVGIGSTIFKGDSIAILNLQRDFPWLDKKSQQAKDVERFRWFSNGYLSVSPDHPNRIIDMRYSFIPNQIQGMWGIELDQNAAPDAHIDYVFDRNRNKDTFKQLWEMIVE